MNPVLVTCPALSLLNGAVHYTKSPVKGFYPVDTKAFFTCHSGYFAFRFDSSVCDTFGNWNQFIITCNGE